jgi:hypothetical protein
MLTPLQNYIAIKNNQAKSFTTPLGKKARQMSENMLFSKELSTRQLILSIWTLKGRPDTWREQLEEYNRKEPVFALLGGITRDDWQPIHQFSEDNKIPCLLPQTNFPVISEKDWYTLYPSKGYFQEGETAARYISAMNTGSNENSKILQLVRTSREGRDLSNGFDRTLRESGQQAATTIHVKTKERITPKLLTQLLEKEKPAAVILWDNSDISHVLELLAASPNRPKSVFVSGRYLAHNFSIIPDKARDFTFITYPYSFAKTATPSSMGSNLMLEDDSKWRVSLTKQRNHTEVQTAKNNSDTITQLLTMALMEMRGDYFRDNFFDVLGMLPDQPSQAFGRLSFGPGQRYASKGCYIVQLSGGSSPELVRKSSWVIH